MVQYNIECAHDLGTIMYAGISRIAQKTVREARVNVSWLHESIGYRMIVHG